MKIIIYKNYYFIIKSYYNIVFITKIFSNKKVFIKKILYLKF